MCGLWEMVWGEDLKEEEGGGYLYAAGRTIVGVQHNEVCVVDNGTIGVE